MIDHIEVHTRRMDAVDGFYSDVLTPLGYERKMDGDVKGYGDAGGLDFFIVEGEPSLEVHYAFAAPSRVVVDEIYNLARERGHQLDRAPALAPKVHADYYAGYVRDPDGRLIEFVCQTPE